MEEHFVKIHKWFYPLSFLYGLGVAFRNKLFDRKILQSKSFNIPIICIGNLAVGGTGKTPHTEYLIKLLQKNYQTAVLSRGYKRRTKGYLLSTLDSDAQSIGDEPYQIKQKFPNTMVAVDENRCHGIENLMAINEPKADVILLDDAFQHRYVEAGLNILLTDYHRLFCDDALLPAGRLREPAKNKSRAQIVIVTKCPEDMKPIDFNIIAKRLKLYPFQRLFFSRFEYGKLIPAFTSGQELALKDLQHYEQILLVTGIASPTSLIDELKKYSQQIQVESFGDHHNFSKKDIKHITERFNNIPSKRKIIITTEKDATRLVNHPDISKRIKDNLYILPIQVKILQNQEYILNQNIIDYVRKNKRDSSIPERENAYKP
ncbi:tetraacyldisaccharide 4'-kinase [Bacteroides sp. 224]|uniref:tetraacyldisaccharide 4'-kinase n=1 Tax=Bacteroides sp. 224 TaxID=2302936 RepID=UPI0013D7E384|nr:tetraacyldisaccharide 4'-kinase [Bacteroides sp. 224]NDV63885.1 tetraacyldisaccharide 4'-kinase [Bacteroides sp. 224]